MEDGRVGNVLCAYSTLMVRCNKWYICWLYPMLQYYQLKYGFKAVLEDWQLAKIRPIFKVVLSTHYNTDIWLVRWMHWPSPQPLSSHHTSSLSTGRPWPTRTCLLAGAGASGNQTQNSSRIFRASDTTDFSKLVCRFHTHWEMWD